jgi:hypothetical protein
VGPLSRDIDAIENDTSLHGRQQARRYPQQTGLAGTVRTQQGNHGTDRDDQIDIAEHES